MVATLQGQYGSGIREAVSYLGQNYMIVEPSIVSDVLQILRDREQFDYCVDITAVHYPEREKQFDLIWILYSFAQIDTALGTLSPSAIIVFTRMRSLRTKL